MVVFGGRGHHPVFHIYACAFELEFGEENRNIDRAEVDSETAMGSISFLGEILWRRTHSGASQLEHARVPVVIR